MSARSKRRGPILFHYTSRGAAVEIMGSRMLQCSAYYGGHLGGGRVFPAGAYATDIPPWTPAYTQRQLSALFFGGSTLRDVSWFVAIDGEEFYRYYGNQWLRQCPAGTFIDVDVYAIGPNLMDP